MGNQQYYIEEGGFSQWLYRTHPDYETIEINGVRGQVIYCVDDVNDIHTSLPSYANTSDVYFRIENGEVVQGKLYLSREMALDFDWDHEHTNKKTGEHFEMGTVHVQSYKKNNKGKFVRDSNKARLMTDAEIEKYGPLIHAFNPNVKFR